MSQVKGVEETLLQELNVPKKDLDNNLGTITNVDVFEKSFSASAVAYAGLQGFTFNRKCLELVNGVISSGVNNLMNNNEVNLVGLLGAQVGLIRLVSLMMAEARKGNRTNLGETDFAAAFGFLCPWEPWCK